MSFPEKQMMALMRGDKALRRVTHYATPNVTLKQTRQRRATSRARQETFLFTLGRPNYTERDFIKKCLKAGEPFPVKKLQLQYWPKKKATKK